MRFYYLMECPECGEDVHYGPVLSMLEHQGLPAVPYDMLSQTQVECGRCLSTIMFGDFAEVMFTEGEDE